MDEAPKVCACKKKQAHFAWGPFVLTLIADAMIASCIYNIFYGPDLSPGNQRVADVLMGNVVVAWVASRAYWYSTTYGSQSKDKVIAQAEPVKPS